MTLETTTNKSVDQNDEVAMNINVSFLDISPADKNLDNETY